PGAGVRHLFGRPPGGVLFLSDGPGGRVGRPRGPPRYPRAARGGVAHGRESLHVRRELHPVTKRGTAARLGRLGLPHARARAAALLLAGAGLAGAIAALGVRLAPSVVGVVGAWLVIVGVAAAVLWVARRGRRDTSPRELGRLAEREIGGRAGSVVGVLAPPPAGGVSVELLALADARAAQAVDRAAPAIRRILARGTRRGVLAGFGAVAAGAALFMASAPTAGRAAAFWHPLRTLAEARAPVRLSVDRVTVRRGDSITVTVEAPAASRATLWTRGPGEPAAGGGRRAGEGGRRRIAPRRDGPAVLGAAAGRRVRHLAARRGDGRRQPARGGGAAARAARGPRLSAGGDGARAGARYDAAPLTAPAAGDRCARRPRAVASPGDELAREPHR